MRKLFLLFAFIIYITSCEKIDKPYNITPDCAGVIGGNNICGCTNSIALNYDSSATYDDGNCCFISGCTNPLASNYDSTACLDDGSCLTDGSIVFDTIQKILIEDFTGHTCPNCPSAATELESIQDFFGDQVIGIALHVGNTFARPYPISQAPKFQYDFRTKWGEEIDLFFEVSNNGLPKGLVNRLDYFTNEHIKSPAEWLTTVQTLLNVTPKFGIAINSFETGSNYNIYVTSKALENLTGNYNLIVCLTEDGIINWQKDVAIEIENYQHKHILRTYLNNTWGEPLKATTNYSAEEEITKVFNVDLTELEEFNEDYSLNTLFQGNGNAGGWNSNNINIIAYIYNTDTYEILQAQEVKLKN